jgi:MFS family permease
VDTLFRPAFGLIWLYSLLTTLAWAATLPVLPLFVQGPLEGGDVAVGVVMSASLLLAAVAQPFLGRLADRRGRRVLLIGGPLVFGAFVASFSIVDSPQALFLLNTGAGLGNAAFVVGAVTVVNDLAPESRRGEAYNVYSLSSWVALGLGPVIGDLVLRTYSFEAVWMVCVGLSLVSAAAALLVAETRRLPDVPEQRSRLVFSRSAAIPGLVLALELFGFAALFVFSPLYARELGMEGAGLVLLVNAAVLVAMRVLGRKLPDRLGAYRSATAGVSLAALGIALPAIFASPAGLYAGAALFGSGHALLYPALFLLAVGRAPEHERSTAVGSLKACEAIGFAAGASLLGVVASVGGYGAVFGLAAALTLTGLIPLRLSRGAQVVVPSRI